MNAEHLLTHFDRIADTPDAIPRLRRFILDLAVRGKLVEEDPNDEPAAELLRRIAAEVTRLKKTGEFHEPKSFVPTKRSGLPFHIPSRWEWVRLIEVARVSYGFAFPANQFNSDRRGMPLIRIRDISSKDTQAHFEGSYDAAYLVKAGDYLVGMDGNFNLRRWAGRDGLLNQRVMRLNGWRCDVVPEFIKLPLQFILDHLHGDTSLTTVKHLSARQVNGIEIPLPPLAEQHRIVAKVDELMALCDRLETARKERETTRNRLAAASLARLSASDPDPAVFQNHAAFTLNNLASFTTRPDQIKVLRQTILNLAVRGKLAPQDPENEPMVERHSGKPECEGLPVNWRWLRLEEFLTENTRNGYSRKPDDAPDGIPILRISAGTTRIDGLVAEEEHKLIGGVSSDVRADYSLISGDLLACRFNGNKEFVGRMKLFKDYLRIQPIYPDKLIRVRVDTLEALPEFVRIAGDSYLVRRQVEAFCATTVGNWGISASKLKKVVFPLPPLAEQHHIVAKVDELMAVCDRLEASLAAGEETRGRLVEAVLWGVLGADGDVAA